MPVNFRPIILIALDRALAWIEGHPPASNRVLPVIGIALAAILGLRIIRKLIVLVLAVVVIGFAVILVGRVLVGYR